MKWNDSSSAEPATMNPPRRTSAPSTAKNSTRPWMAAGTAKYVRSSAKTKTLSTERLRSIR